VKAGTISGWDIISESSSTSGRLASDLGSLTATFMWLSFVLPRLAHGKKMAVLERLTHG